MSSKNTYKQIPNEVYTFRCGCSGVLPNLGEHNEFARWAKDDKHSRGGVWMCLYHQNFFTRRRRRGEGPSGIYGRMKSIFDIGQSNAKYQNGGYTPPNTSPEKMIAMWHLQDNKCAACGSPLELLKAAFDHNHGTGEARGFICRECNLAEGCLKHLSDEAFEKWIKYVRPNYCHEVAV